MKCQKNSHLNLKDRLELVSYEILEEFPRLSVEDSVKVATFYDIIMDDQVNADILFRRYYYLMYVLGGKNCSLFEEFLLHMKNNCSLELKDPLNQLLYEDIIKYNQNELDVFPCISQYYVD